MWKYRLMWSLWPGFLGACALSLLFFAAIDPHSLTLFGNEEALSAAWTYTAGFFVFWAVCFWACFISLTLAGGGQQPKPSLNQRMAIA